MGDRCQRFLQDLMQKPGNDICADCRGPSPEWASSNLGIFLCKDCAGIHRSLGVHISKVKSIKLDKWEEDQVKIMEAKGNSKVKAKYEEFVPPYYRQPNRNDPYVMREQWIRAKYERYEFTDVDRQVAYCTGYKEGYLMKRGKDDKKFCNRRFVLSQSENTLKYYNKDDGRGPKATMSLDQVNIVLVPDKMENQNGMQLMFEQDGATRSLYLYGETGKDTLDWYTAIRAAKLMRLKIAFPGTDDKELCSRLTRDFLKEGYLYKTGPRPGDAWRKRWFTLDKRKLLYFEDPKDAFPKGEIFLGSREKNFGILEGVPPQIKEIHYGFTLRTPDREFHLSAETPEDYRDWVDLLKMVIKTPPNPQEISSKNRFL